MSTSKKRRMLVSLGSIDSGSSSIEVDLSSMTHAFIHMKRASSGTACVVQFEASPQEFGESPTWYDMRELTTLPTGQSTATRGQMIMWAASWPDILVTFAPISAIPLASGYGFLDTPIPRRIRVSVTGSSDIDWAYIEGLRSVA